MKNYNEGFTYDDLWDIYHALQSEQSRTYHDKDMDDDDKRYLCNRLRNVSHKVMLRMEKIENENSN